MTMIIVMKTFSSGARRRVLAFVTLLSAAAWLGGPGLAAAASPRIVNGLDTQGFPTTGALLHHIDAPITSVNAASWCSGTLIGCHTLLTAAHCAGTGFAGTIAGFGETSGAAHD